jgi:hypothetical protein
MGWYRARGWPVAARKAKTHANDSPAG